MGIEPDHGGLDQTDMSMGIAVDEFLEQAYASNVIQDSCPCEGIRERAYGLARVLSSEGYGRLALMTRRVDVILAVLLACQRSGWDLVLLRERFSIHDPVWEQWNVDAMLDEDLSVVPLRSSRASPGSSILLTTSGTTGTPKLVSHSLDALLGRIRRPQRPTERIAWLLTYHPASFAGMQVVLTAASCGSELIALSDSSVPVLAKEALERKPTHISGTPTFWRSFLVWLGSRAQEIPLQQITSGGEAVDQATLDRLQQTFPSARVIHIYASTEAGALFAVTDGRAGFPVKWLGNGVEGTELRIVDGVLEVRSPRAMKGYVGPNAPIPSKDDGWIDTRDAVQVVDDRVQFVGRTDNIINVGGAKVLPEEVEAVLLSLPMVYDARVVGLPNPVTGQIVAAEVVVSPDMDKSSARDIIMERANQALDRHKVPRVVRFVYRISSNSAGKKDRTQGCPT